MNRLGCSVRLEPGQQLGPGVIRRLLVVGLSVVRVKSMTGIWVKNYLGLVSRLFEFLLHASHAVDRNARVLTAVEAYHRDLQFLYVIHWGGRLSRVDRGIGRRRKPSVPCRTSL